PFRADLAGDAGDFGSKGSKLVHHDVDGVLQLQDFAAHVDGDLLRQVSVRNGGGDLRNVAHLAGQVRRHEVDVVRQVLPRSCDPLHLCLAAHQALGADLPCHAGDFRGEAGELVDHRVDGVLEFQYLAADVDRDLLRQVAIRNGGGHLRNVADLA